MHVWVLSHLRSSPGTLSTIELFENAGCKVSHVDPDSVHLTLDPGATPPLGIIPDTLARPDLVYTRLGSSAPARALDVLRHLEAMGLECVNPAIGLERSRDKFRSYQLMACNGLPVPKSVLVSTEVDLKDMSVFLGEAPWIVKVPMSTKGAGVCIVDSYRSLKSVVGTLLSVHDRVLVQEFIEEAAGTDIRVLVLDGEPILAVRRSSGSPDEFRSNVALGGADTHSALDDDMARIAREASRLHGLAVAGIDLLESRDGYMIAEVNGSPGLAGPRRQHAKLLQDSFTQFVERMRARVLS